MIVTDPELSARMVSIAERARAAVSLRPFSEAYAEFEACCASINRPCVVGDMMTFTGQERARVEARSGDGDA